MNVVPDEVILRVARKVRRRFVRKGNPADPDDVEQEAALQALESAARGRLKPGRAPTGYLYRAAVVEVGLVISRSVAVVSISERMARRAREFRGRVPIADCGYAGGDEESGEAGAVQLPSGAGALPDARLRAVEIAKARVAFDIRRRRLIEAYLPRLPADQARVVSLVMGLDGPASSVGGAAIRIGIPKARALGALTKLRNLAFADFELRRLRRAEREVQE